jgi:hypothetical protein
MYPDRPVRITCAISRKRCHLYLMRQRQIVGYYPHLRLGTTDKWMILLGNEEYIHSVSHFFEV